MIPQQYFTHVKTWFGGNDKRAWDWFKEINPAFGMLSPLNMIKLGKESTVKTFIEKEMPTCP